ncbi:unnamed protein product [Moneuplotes crassus]|uniref:Uncharacterized protein n=1 Tax=Euplotes crassus TaxID=5936 RepID=A0AAD1XHU1_EUPCR|nr:unnamed protein product [Moneuplotes crassus]
MLKCCKCKLSSIPNLKSLMKLSLCCDFQQIVMLIFCRVQSSIAFESLYDDARVKRLRLYMWILTTGGRDNHENLEINSFWV